jgi:hypothetical protein
VLIANNTVANNQYNVVMHGYPRDTRQVVNNRAVNNIIVEGRSTDLVLPSLNTTACNNNTSDYNLFYRASGGVRISWVPSDTDYSVRFYDLASCISASGLEKNSKVGNPMFRNSAAGDYSLQPTSPAVDMGLGGLTQVGDKDYQGLARSQGARVDAGAFERPKVAPPTAVKAN